uniref:Uncharacterized protein n=1 Tax=Terrapene triunguis TaxID=2587831 RepID=A0A674K7H3_9SAUR
MELPGGPYVNYMSAEGDPASETSLQISANDFSCICCCAILVNPTTLSWEHTSSQHCLCPQCRKKNGKSSQRSKLFSS